MLSATVARAWLLGLALLAGCAAPSAPPSPPQVASAAAADGIAQRFAALQARQGGRLYRVDPAASAVRIYVFRAGRAARLGHNHLLAAPRFEAWLQWPEDALPQASFELQLRLEDLLLDEPALRAAAGGAFAAPLSSEAVAATRANMLSERGLDAARFPLLGLRLLSLVGEPPRLAARIELSLHGRSQQLALPLSVRDEGARLQIAGAFVLRQSELGLQPFSVLGGLLAVQDELVVEFELRALLQPQ